MLFVADQILVSKSEDDLQYSVNYFNNIGTEFCKIMALRGSEPFTNKICVYDIFNYLRYYISYEEEKDLNVKTVILSNCLEL
jgi:hypothetical protein